MGQPLLFNFIGYPLESDLFYVWYAYRTTYLILVSLCAHPSFLGILIQSHLSWCERLYKATWPVLVSPWGRLSYFRISTGPPISYLGITTKPPIFCCIHMRAPMLFGHPHDVVQGPLSSVWYPYGATTGPPILHHPYRATLLCIGSSRLSCIDLRGRLRLRFLLRLGGSRFPRHPGSSKVISKAYREA